MKKVNYLFLSLLMCVLSIGLVEAKSDPTYSIDLNVTKISGTDNIAINAIVKNTATTCDGVGLKQGKVYFYLDENIVAKATNISGIYRNYDESTGEFTESAVACSYDGANHRVACSFGRTESNLVNYSDCKDELAVTFETSLCEGSTDCDIKVEVFGEPIDYNNGNPTSLGSAKTVSTNDFTCNSKVTTPNTPTTPSNPTTPDNGNDNTYEPEENPNTIDNGVVYMLLGTLSLVLIATVIMVNKKKKLG